MVLIFLCGLWLFFVFSRTVFVCSSLLALDRSRLSTASMSHRLFKRHAFELCIIPYLFLISSYNSFFNSYVIQSASRYPVHARLLLHVRSLGSANMFIKHCHVCLTDVITMQSAAWICTLQYRIASFLWHY